MSLNHEPPHKAYNPKTGKVAQVAKVHHILKLEFAPDAEDISAKARKDFLKRKEVAPYERFFMTNALEGGGVNLVTDSKELTATEKLVWFKYMTSLKIGNEVCDQSQIISSLGLTPQFVSVATKKLIELGFLEKVDSRYRIPKEFAYRGSIKNFNKPKDEK